MVHQGQEVVLVGGSHALHHHEKLSIAVSKVMRSHSLQETKTDGRFHVHTKTYLDGAILKEEMERSADVRAVGLLEVSDPSLSSKYFLRQTWMDDADRNSDSILKHKPLWASYGSKRLKDKKKRSEKRRQGDLFRTYGTRVAPVFVLSLPDVDDHLMMEDESLVWTSNDVVIVLQHQNEQIPLSYVSELQRRYAVPSQAQRHILAGLASVVSGLSAPYEKASPRARETNRELALDSWPPSIWTVFKQYPNQSVTTRCSTEKRSICSHRCCSSPNKRNIRGHSILCLRTPENAIGRTGEG